MRSGSALFDDLGREREQRRRHGKAEGLGGLEVDPQFKFGWLLDREIGRFRTLENSRDIVAANAATHSYAIHTVAHQATGIRERSVGINCRQFVEGGQRHDFVYFKDTETTEIH